MILDEFVVVKVQPPGGVLVLEILHVQPIDELFGEADQIASAIVPRGSTGPIRSEERRRTLESWPLVAASRACGPGHDSFASLHGVQPPGVSAMSEELQSTRLQPFVHAAIEQVEYVGVEAARREDGSRAG